MFVDAWEHALVFNEVVFILFPLVRGALGIPRYRMYFHLKNAATPGRVAPCSANSIAQLGIPAWAGGGWGHGAHRCHPASPGDRWRPGAGTMLFSLDKLSFL